MTISFDSITQKRNIADIVYKRNSVDIFHIKCENQLQLQATLASKELDAYAKAASIVEEALNGIRTVFAFGGEKVEVDRYAQLLVPAEKAATRKGLYSSINDGVTRFLFFVSCALSFWYGVQWVLRDRDQVDREYTPATLLIVSEVLGCLSIKCLK